MASEKSRAKVFNIRFTAKEWARAESLAAAHELTVAGLFRMLLKQEETKHTARGAFLGAALRGVSKRAADETATETPGGGKRAARAKASRARRA